MVANMYFQNSMDPGQIASLNWSESTVFEKGLIQVQKGKV